MTKLKDIIGETYYPKNKDEQNFWDKHQVELFKNMYSTAEYDPVFKGTKIKVSPREADRHGYSGSPSPKGTMGKAPDGNDVKVYESDETVDENSYKAGKWHNNDRRAEREPDPKVGQEHAKTVKGLIKKGMPEKEARMKAKKLFNKGRDDDEKEYWGEAADKDKGDK